MQKLVVSTFLISVLFASTAMASGEFCPVNLPLPGPSYGEDTTDQVKTYYASSGESSSETVAESDANANKIAAEAIKHVGEDWSYRGRKDETSYNNYNGHQWCAYFATSMLRAAGYDIPKMSGSKAVLRWFSSHGHSTFTDPAQAAAGDIIVWSRGGESGHIGIVVANDTEARRLSTVEGNVEGDKVKRYTRSYDNVKSHMNGLVGFGRW